MSGSEVGPEVLSARLSGISEAEWDLVRKELQRRRARDVGDRCAREFVERYVAVCAGQHLTAREALLSTTLWRVNEALAAERKAGRNALRSEMLRVELNQALIDAGLFEAVPRGVPAIESALRAYRDAHGHGSIDDALEREG